MLHTASTPFEPRAPRMTLTSVTRGRIEAPPRVLLVGTPGVGKSTFAAAAPSPIFLPAEEGTNHLDVARFPRPESWADVLDAVETLTVEPHDHRTLVVDTLDAIEPLVFAEVCREAGKPTIEEVGGGFGKGYTAALDKWRTLLSAFERLRAQRQMTVIMLAHTVIKSFKNPEGSDYDRYIPKLNEKAAGLLDEWVDAHLFARHETYAVGEGKAKAKGISTGARVLRTQRTAAFNAKNRYDLPDTMPLSWADFASAVAAHAPASLDVLRAELEELAAKVDPKTRAAVLAWMPTVATNAAELARGVDRLRAKLLTTSA